MTPGLSSPPSGGDAERALLRHFVATYPARSAVLVVLLILAGLAEGIGLLGLFPLLEVVAGGESAGGGSAGGGSAGGSPERVVAGALEGVGIEPTLGVLLAVIVAALVAKGVLRWVAMRHVGNTVARVARELRVRLVRSLLAARWTHLGGERAGEIAVAVGRDAFWASYAYRHACAAAAAGVQVVVYAAVLLLLSAGAGVAAVAVAAALAAALGFFVRASRRAGAAQTERSRRLAFELLDVVGGLKAIRAMGFEGPYARLLERRAAALERAERRQVLAVESLHAFQEPLLALLLAPAVWLAVTRAGLGFATLTMGVFVVHRLVTRSHQLQSEYQGMVAAEAAFRALHAQTLAAEREREPAGGRVAPPSLERGIELRGVTAGYGDRPVIRGASLEIPAGRLTVLQGASGAGKTTLLDLLLGLQEPTDGVVLVDGVPMHEIDRSAWRRGIGYVPQDPVLLHGTVRENLLLGEEPVDPSRLGPARLERALRAADAWSLVQRLPRGLDTIVGERGSLLSGGERRRLALARALAREPRLLVLDEPTAELDAAAEAAVVDRLLALRGGTTIVVAAHAAALADRADVLVEVEGGRPRAVARP